MLKAYVSMGGLAFSGIVDLVIGQCPLLDREISHAVAHTAHRTKASITVHLLANNIVLIVTA